MSFLMLRCLLIPLLSFSFLSICSGSSSDPNFPIWQAQFNKAEDFGNSFHNDSCFLILSNLYDDIDEAGQLNSPFGLKVQLRLAEALERDHQDELAITKLIELTELSKKYEAWSVLAHAQLSLARMQEKLYRWPNCLKHLREAQTTIEKYQLDTVYTRFSIRIASYHRLNGDRDSAIYYAQEVLRTAPMYKLKADEAVGNMLMGMLMVGKSNEKAINHFTQSGKTFRSLEDFAGYSYTENNLSRIYFLDEKYEESLIHNDSTIAASKKAIEIGHQQHWTLANALKFRGRIFRKLGQQDSAWYYLNVGFEQEIEDMSRVNTEKVIEIDAKYNDEKKALMIEEQAKVIQLQQEKRNRNMGILALVLIFAGTLSYYYFQLKKANQKTVEQAAEIAKANEGLSVSLQHQIMLQGEVHHRVKNNLQVIISLLELQKDDITDPMARKSLEMMSSRIYSMAAIHEILYQKQGTEAVNLLDYANNLCKHFKTFTEEKRQPIFNLDIGNKYFNLATLMPLGIILNELLTNSLKYANNIKEQLIINLSLSKGAEGYCLTFRDNGPGFPTGMLVEREGGLGTYLLKSMSRQLSGRMETVNDHGAVCNIYFKEKEA